MFWNLDVTSNCLLFSERIWVLLKGFCGQKVGWKYLKSVLKIVLFWVNLINSLFLALFLVLFWELKKGHLGYICGCRSGYVCQLGEEWKSDEIKVIPPFRWLYIWLFQENPSCQLPYVTQKWKVCLKIFRNCTKYNELHYWVLTPHHGTNKTYPLYIWQMTNDMLQSSMEKLTMKAW